MIVAINQTFNEIFGSYDSLDITPFSGTSGLVRAIPLTPHTVSTKENV
jgi:hypothetical protein